MQVGGGGVAKKLPSKWVSTRGEMGGGLLSKKKGRVG